MKYIPFQELQLIYLDHNALGSQSSGFLGNLLEDRSVFVSVLSLQNIQKQSGEYKQVCIIDTVS